MALTNEQKRILAQTLLGEAGGEGYDGMVAVAHVLNNRTLSGRFPNDPVTVAKQPQQFTAWNEGEGGNNPGRFGPGSPGFEDAMRAVDAVFVQGVPDPTGGATHYWSPSGMKAMGYDETPYWANSETGPGGQVKIGRHVYLAQREPSAATQAAEEMGGNRVSYGNELGQVPLSELPMPRPDPRSQIGNPTDHNRRVINTAAAPFGTMPYPIERGQVHPDPRIAFHNTTFDRRPTQTIMGQPSTRNQVRAETLMGIMPPRQTQSKPTNRRNEERAERLTVTPAKRVTQPSPSQVNTRVAPTVQTAGYTRMPDAEFERISQQMRVASQAEGIGSYPTQAALKSFSPSPTPAPTPASLPRRNEMMAEALMGAPAPKTAPVPATAPANLRGDPLAHIVPDIPAPVSAGMIDPLAAAIANPTFTTQPLVVMGQPQPVRRPEPPRQPGLSAHGRKFNTKTNRWETPGKSDLGKVGFTMHRNSGTIF